MRFLVASFLLATLGAAAKQCDCEVLSARVTSLERTMGALRAALNTSFGSSSERADISSVAISADGGVPRFAPPTPSALPRPALSCNKQLLSLRMLCDGEFAQHQPASTHVCDEDGGSCTIHIFATPLPPYKRDDGSALPCQVCDAKGVDCRLCSNLNSGHCAPSAPFTHAAYVRKVEALFAAGGDCDKDPSS